jgi:hypothetical protein
MGLFSGKGKDKKGDKKGKKKRRMLPVEMRKRVVLPPEGGFPKISSREYRIFKKERGKSLGWYERLANLSEKFLKVNPGEKARAEIENAIGFTGLRITSSGVMSLFVSTILLFVVLGIVFMLTNVLTGALSMTMMMIGLMIIALGLLISYYLMRYPSNLVKTLRIQASSQVVLAVLYMVISMRLSPNLERALQFSASNVSGELSRDMRRLLWDIEMGKYYSAKEAMSDYIAKWKPENEEFAEALRLIRDSTTHTPEKSKGILDQSLEVILDGTKTRMKHYSQDLQLPVNVIHMMGILLPILGTIMAPMAAVFMSDLISPWHFAIGYNVALPIVILWFIRTTLSKRPMTFSKVDVSQHPDLPPEGTFRVGKKTRIPVFPIALLVLMLFMVFPVMFFMENIELLESGAGQGHNIFSLVMSAMIILGLGFSISIYFILANFQRAGIHNEIQKAEGEFELALFQLGNRISGGTPTELAVEKSIDDVKDLEIAKLFRLTLRNIRQLGMTFEQALFDRKWGSLRHYPSSLIRNVMYVVVDTAKTGVRYAAESMLRISNYLKNLRETQEYIRELLAETVSSMKFQAYFLTPLITGLIVSMADVIVKVLATLGCYLEGMMTGDSDVFGGIGNLFGTGSPISPEIFQMIVGIYLIEVIMILGIFITKISIGENKTLQWYSVGKMLVVGVVIYFLVAVTASAIFGELITEALSGLGVMAACSI